MKRAMLAALALALFAGPALAADANPNLDAGAPVVLREQVTGNTIGDDSTRPLWMACASGCSAGASSADTHAQTSALAASLVAKASAGTLKSFEVGADSTLSASAWWVMIFDATSLPADGAVTPAKCYPIPANQPVAGGTFGAAGVGFTTGIVIGVSTTGCFSKTASTHAFIGADYQ